MTRTEPAPTGALTGYEPNRTGPSHIANGNGRSDPLAVGAATALLEPPPAITSSSSVRTFEIPARRTRLIRRPATLTRPPVALAPAPLVVLAALGFVLLLALMIRVSAARQLTTQVDEPATLLAAHQIVERGLPILPSDTLYLHGATLSYTLAPLVWAGYGDLDDIQTLRMTGVVAGVVAVALTFWLGFRISGSAWAGALAALLLAIDPVSVQWSAHLRMYAYLQALTLLVLVLALGVLVRPSGRRAAVGLVVVFWLAVFTHVGAALILPPLVVVAAIVHGRELLRSRKDLSFILVGCLVAPLALSTLNRLFQPKDYRALPGVPFFSFAGEGLFNFERLRLPRTNAWRDLFGEGYARDFLPYVVVAFVGLVAGRYLIGRAQTVWGDRPGSIEADRRIMIGAVVAVYVSSVLVVSFFTWEQTPRYLLHIHPIGYVLLATGLAIVLKRVRPIEGNLAINWRRWLPQAGIASFTVVFALIVLADGLAVRLRDPFVDTDQVAALRYVAEHRQPGELVITSLPPAPYLALGGDDELVFLAGSELTNRVNRYTRLTADGRTVDYWIGIDAITSTPQLCQTLLSRPDAWIVVDEDRLTEEWAYGGEMEEVILRMTELVAIAPGGVLIYRRFVPPPGSTIATPACGGHRTIPTSEDSTPSTSSPQQRSRS